MTAPDDPSQRPTQRPNQYGSWDGPRDRQVESDITPDEQTLIFPVSSWDEPDNETMWPVHAGYRDEPFAPSEANGAFSTDAEPPDVQPPHTEPADAEPPHAEPLNGAAVDDEPWVRDIWNGAGPSLVQCSAASTDGPERHGEMGGAGPQGDNPQDAGAPGPAGQDAAPESEAGHEAAPESGAGHGVPESGAGHGAPESGAGQGATPGPGAEPPPYGGPPQRFQVPPTPPTWPQQPPQAQQPGGGLGTASMVLGIISVVLLFLCGLGVLTAVVAAILGVIALVKDSNRTRAIIGLVLSLVTFVLAAILGAILYNWYQAQNFAECFNPTLHPTQESAQRCVEGKLNRPVPDVGE